MSSEIEPGREEVLFDATASDKSKESEIKTNRSAIISLQVQPDATDSAEFINFVELLKQLGVDKKIHISSENSDHDLNFDELSEGLQNAVYMGIFETVTSDLDNPSDTKIYQELLKIAGVLVSAKGGNLTGIRVSLRAEDKEAN